MKMSMYHFGINLFEIFKRWEKILYAQHYTCDFPQKPSTSFDLHFVSSKRTWGIGFESQRESLHV